ncbi:THAP domain-containing protein 11 [Protopterus annectens]|uniref:THAP domain-containing protein 11 n=1 Tax=Protopterus annectens TaxID=7888 RepID=UPI001CF98B5E|nr:THAP domain-containing protein 11 [Protopterus annectens]
MPGFTCCVPGCYNNSHRDKALHFYTFPKDAELRKQWLKNVSRTGVNGCFSTFQPTTGHRVCSVHFQGGRKTYSIRVPTIFPLRGVNEKKGRRSKKKLAVADNRTVGLQRIEGSPAVTVGGSGEDFKPIDLTVPVDGSTGPGLSVVTASAASRLGVGDISETFDHSYSLSSGTTSDELLKKLNEQRDIIALMEVKMKEMKGTIRHLKITEAKLKEEVREKDRLLSMAVIRKKHGM